MAKAVITQAAIERAIRAAKAADFQIGAFEVTADGTVRIILANSDTDKDPFKEWQKEHGDRAA
jgi:hypothetical protein